MRANRRHGIVRVVVSIVVLLSCTALARAQIANGDFEGGFYGGGVAVGWTLFSTDGYSPSASDETSNVHGGAHAQKIHLPQPPYGQGEGYGGISQVFNTIPGQLYRIDFWMYAHMPYEQYEGEDLQVHLVFDAQGRPDYDHDLAGSDFDISIIGVDTDRDIWKSMGREFQAASSQATVFFRGWRKFEQHGPGYIIIDDVTVQPVDVTHPPSHAAVPPPEPPTLIGSNMLANPDFEEDFTSGVANNWQSWTTRGTGTFKASSDLGKIGGGHYNPDGAAAFLWLSETTKVAFAMPPVLNQLVTIKQRDPEILTVARHIDDNFNFWDEDDDGTRAEAYAHAERCYDLHLEKRYQEGGEMKPGIDAWQGFNEPWAQSRERARKAGLFAQAFSERCHVLGIRSVILNLGVANPLEDTDAEFFKDALAVADFVGYHSYGGSDDMWQTGPQQDGYALRWRAIKNHYDNLGWRHPAVVYTEAGTYFGWKSIGGATPEMVRDKYIEFGPYMQADDWCVGEAIFTVGGYGLWDYWDIADDPEIIEGLRPWNQDNSADAHDGKAQQWHHDGSNFRGGIVQTVGTNAGDYWLSGWFKYETGIGGDPASPDITFLVGYDPTGQTSNGDAATILWSNDQISSRYLNAYTWYEFALPVIASGSQTSIWFALDQPTTSPTGRAYVDSLDFRAAEGTAPPPPQIELDPTTLTHSSHLGTDATDQTFTIRNSGGGLLVYNVTDDATWLQAIPASGTCSASPDTITIQYATSSLDMGTYYTTITVSDPNATNDLETIEVALIVTVPPDFDGDGDVDQKDFSHLQACFTGDGIPQNESECLDARFDLDEDVDGDDLGIFQACLSGANVLASPACMD